MMIDTPIPSYLADAPKDKRGFPITYTSIKLPDGRYDFTTSDPRKWQKVVMEGRCALCGKLLAGSNKMFTNAMECWFIGGPKCMSHRLFFDPAMHEECARYALKVCPYIAVPAYLGAKKRLVPDEFRLNIASSDKVKPDRFGLAETNHYRPVIFQGDLLVQAGEWGRPIEWWKDGEQIA